MHSTDSIKATNHSNFNSNSCLIASPSTSLDSNSLEYIHPFLVHLVVIHGPTVYHWVPSIPFNQKESNLITTNSFQTKVVTDISSRITKVIPSEKSLSISSSETLHASNTDVFVPKIYSSVAMEVSQNDIKLCKDAIIEWVKDCVYQSIHHDIYPLQNLISHHGEYQLFLERSDSNFFKKYSLKPNVSSTEFLLPCPYKYTAILCPIFWRKPPCKRNLKPLNHLSFKRTTNPSSSTLKKNKSTSFKRSFPSDHSFHHFQEMLCDGNSQTQGPTNHPPAKLFPNLNPKHAWEVSKHFLKELKQTFESKPSFDMWSYP